MLFDFMNNKIYIILILIIFRIFRLHTGDLCSMDSEGYLYFKSREKDMIIRGGANLYPAEIESFIRTHPNIIDAYVIGVIFLAIPRSKK